MTSGLADIDLIFEKQRDQGYSFDGRGGELAYAFFPGNNKGGLIKSLNFFILYILSKRTARFASRREMSEIRPEKFHTDDVTLQRSV